MQLDKEEMDKEAMLMIADMIKERGGEMTDGELKAISKMAQRPTYPVITNPEADEMEYDVRTKMEVDENGESATLYMVPEDIEGMYDYIPDIQSMALNSSDERKNGRIRALELIVRPDIKQQLAEEGEKAQIKDLLIAVLEGESIDDAERFFEKQPNPVGTGQLGAVPEAQGINPAEGMVGPTPDVLGQGEISVPQPAGLQ